MEQQPKTGDQNMTDWQHDFFICPRAVLMETFGCVPPSIAEGEFDRQERWTGVAFDSDEFTDEFAQLLPHFKRWGEHRVLWWTSTEFRHRVALVFDVDGNLTDFKINVNLTYDYHFFIEALTAIATKNGWCFVSSCGTIFMPDSEAIIEKLNRVRASQTSAPPSYDAIYDAIPVVLPEDVRVNGKPIFHRDEHGNLQFGKHFRKPIKRG
jgi:hypothetical protein